MNVIDNIKNTYIKESTIHGLGLFAISSIGDLDVLTILDGQRLTWNEYSKLTIENDIFSEWNALDLNTLLFRPHRTKYSFINHSRSPNCKLICVDSKLLLITNTSIEKDEELTLDYRKEPLPESYLTGHGSTYL